jgi:hypothetical protein
LTWQTTQGLGFRGALLIQRGEAVIGMRLLRAALDKLRETGLVRGYPAFLGELAEGSGRAGQACQGLVIIDEALSHAERHEERWCVAELLRIKGELLLLENEPNAAAAEDEFLRLLDWARGTSIFIRPKPWMYVSIETQNKDVHVSYGGRQDQPGDRLPRRDAGRAEQHQGTSGGRHSPPPSGRPFPVRGKSRPGNDRVDGKQVFKDGENSIVVYSIDQFTGEPTPIQHIETQKIHPRTFHIDSSGRLLLAQHNLPVNVKDGDTIKALPAGLSVFRIGDDGKLTFVRKYDIDVGDKTMF